MYYVKKTIEISASHQLRLDYESKCENLQAVTDRLDHRNLNEVLPFNPTAENIAHWIVQSIPECYRADVQESRNNLATYVKDDDDAEGE